MVLSALELVEMINYLQATWTKWDHRVEKWNIRKNPNWVLLVGFDSKTDWGPAKKRLVLSNSFSKAYIERENVKNNKCFGKDFWTII